jgi:hypothetical protein
LKFIQIFLRVLERVALKFLGRGGLFHKSIYPI